MFLDDPCFSVEMYRVGSLELMRLRKSLNIVTATGGKAASKRMASKRKAAVLVPLCNIDGRASLIYTLRTKKVGTHKGQVSFPGGHIDVGETVPEAAVRELREELGLDLKVDVLGCGERLPAVTGTLVTPVVAFLPGEVSVAAMQANRSKDEVESVFSVALEDLADPNNQSVEDLGARCHSCPVYENVGPARIWGLTAYMTNDLLTRHIFPSFDNECSKL